MKKSGIHDNDAFNFVQVTMQEFHGLTPIAIYYFYTRCEEHTDIDCIFQPTMDESLKGNSITVGIDDSDTPPSSVESKLTHYNLIYYNEARTGYGGFTSVLH